MKELLESKFMGRKYTLTGGIVALTAFLAWHGHLNSDVALVFTGAITSLNFALRNTG